MAQGSSVAEGVGTSKPWWAEEGAAIAIAVGLGLRCSLVRSQPRPLRPHSTVDMSTNAPKSGRASASMMAATGTIGTDTITIPAKTAGPTVLK